MGDHQPLLMKVCARSVLRAALPRIVPAKVMKLKSKVECIQTKYISKYHGIYRKLQTLEQTASFPVLAEVKTMLEGINKMMTKLMAITEAK